MKRSGKQKYKVAYASTFQKYEAMTKQDPQGFIIALSIASCINKLL
jgi:hypothetical protein